MTTPNISPHVVVIGEALIDIVTRFNGQTVEVPGGSPANVALTLGRLGRTVQLLTRLGEDARGRTVRAWLEESDVVVAAVSSPRTATATALLDAAGAATYTFDIDWDLAGGTVPVGGIVHTGSIAALQEPGAGEVKRILEQARPSALVTYDPNIRPALLGSASAVRSEVEALVVLSDLVKASDEDLRWLYPQDDPLAVAKRWLRSGPAVVIVTRGEGGAFAVAQTGLVEVPAQLVDVVDTVGAGDTFMGGLIDELLRHGFTDADSRDELRDITHAELEAVLRFGARAAAITVSRPGADPPRRAEMIAGEDSRQDAL